MDSPVYTDPLKHLRDLREKKITDTLSQPVREYLQLRASAASHAQRDLAELKILEPQLRPVLEDAKKAYCGAEDLSIYPVLVKKLLVSRRDAILWALDMLNRCPPMLTAWLNRTGDGDDTGDHRAARGPQAFVYATPATLWEEDRRDLAPWLDRAPHLRDVPQRIEELTRQVNAEVKKALQAEREGRGAPVPWRGRGAPVNHIEETRIPVETEFDPFRR